MDVTGLTWLAALALWAASLLAAGLCLGTGRRRGAAGLLLGCIAGAPALWLSLRAIV